MSLTICHCQIKGHLQRAVTNSYVTDDLSLSEQITFAKICHCQFSEAYPYFVSEAHPYFVSEAYPYFVTHTTFQELLLTPITVHEILGFDIFSSEKHFCHGKISEIFIRAEV